MSASSAPTVGAWRGRDRGDDPRSAARDDPLPRQPRAPRRSVTASLAPLKGPWTSWPRAASLALLAGRLLLAACAGEAPASLRVPSASGVSGCGSTAARGSSTVRLTVDGRRRLAVIHVPTGYTGAAKVPLVVNLHGSGATAVDQEGPMAAGDWASAERCSTPPATQSRRGYTLTAYSGCGGGASVELYTIAGEGHEWPGGPKLPARLTSALGPQSTAVDADSIMWSFFAAHPLS